ncbi:MAG TPA: tripartite tricarboxylate transporter TctB family protein [Thermodesulfobacteriota bacterium]|nr:tripartite tricarboxylate transporter TctB family protein [Thermodesulfobacteriota bacterium]
MEIHASRNQKITGFILFGFSLFYFFSSLRLKLGTFKNPGPGLIPVAIGGFLLLCTGIYLIRVLRLKPPGEGNLAPSRRGPKNYPAIFGILGCTLAYPFLLEYGKFILSTFAIAYLMLAFLKPSRTLFPFFLALGMAVGSFLVFSRFLGVALPSGFLEDFLFRIGG